MATRWRGTGVQVSLVTLSGRVGRLGAAVRDCFDDFEVVRPLRGGLSMAWPLSVARAIRRTRPDVVHVHSGCWLKGARAARLAGVRRVVFTEHGREHDDPWIRRWIDRAAASYTDTVVAVSHRLASYLARKVGINSARFGRSTKAATRRGFPPAALRPSCGTNSPFRPAPSVSGDR